jgi:hypothetical protein
VDRAWTELEAALEAFKRLARRAVDVAADRRSARAEVDEARHQATFALAAVGAALKRAFKASRGEEADASP